MATLAHLSSPATHAQWGYELFGEPTCVTGRVATLNPFRFSTKRTEPTTDLVLYEYRAYSPTLRRWLNRDPIEESGGRNLYGFVYNSPIRRIDRLGLFVETCRAALKAIAARCACKAAAAGKTGSAGGPLAAIACVAGAAAAELVAVDVALAMEGAALEKQNEQDAQEIDEKSREYDRLKARCNEQVPPELANHGNDIEKLCAMWRW